MLIFGQYRLVEYSRSNERSSNESRGGDQRDGCIMRTRVSLPFTRNIRGSSRTSNGSAGVNACVPPHVHPLFSWLYLICKDSGTKAQERSSLWIWRGVWPPRRPKRHRRTYGQTEARVRVKYRDSNLTGTYWAPLTIGEGSADRSSYIPRLSQPAWISIHSRVETRPISTFHREIRTSEICSKGNQISDDTFGDD